MKYRRAFIPGGSFFFTVVTEKRRPLLASAESVEILRMAIRAVRIARPFFVDAMVVLPDHLHCIWTLPPGDADIALRWRLVKTWFTKHCDPALRIGPNRPVGETRTGHLAASLLGAHAAGRRGFRPAC